MSKGMRVQCDDETPRTVPGRVWTVDRLPPYLGYDVNFMILSALCELGLETAPDDFIEDADGLFDNDKRDWT